MVLHSEDGPKPSPNPRGPPRIHRHRYYGVFAPNAPLRPLVTERAQEDNALATPSTTPDSPLPLTHPARGPPQSGLGRFNPVGGLPFELPSSMEAVRDKLADVPFDSEDPLFPYGSGLSYPGGWEEEISGKEGRGLTGPLL